MSVAKKAIFIVGAKRTPFGAFGGKQQVFRANDEKKGRHFFLLKNGRPKKLLIKNFSTANFFG